MTIVLGIKAAEYHISAQARKGWQASSLKALARHLAARLEPSDAEARAEAERWLLHVAKRAIAEGTR